MKKEKKKMSLSQRIIQPLRWPLSGGDFFLAASSLIIVTSIS